MWIYIVLLLISLICGYGFRVNKFIGYRKMYIITMFFIITMVMALRKYTVGIDLERYYAIYYPRFAQVTWGNLQAVTISGDWEWGFCAFCKLLCYLSTDVQALIIATSIINGVVWGYFIFKNSDDVVFSTSFFIMFNVMFTVMNIVRQSLAVCMVIIAIECLKKDRYLKYAIFIGVATLFHTSGLIALVYLFIKRIRFKKSQIIPLTGGIVAFVFLYKIVFLRLLQISFLNKLYAIYLTSVESVGYITINSVGTFVIAAITFAVSVLYFDEKVERKLLCKNTKHKRKLVIKGLPLLRKRRTSWNSETSDIWNDSQLLYGSYVAMMFRFCTFFINVVSRFGLYFYPMLMISVPHQILKIKNKNSRNGNIVIIAYYAVLLFYFLGVGFMRAGQLFGTVPYLFFWQ